LRLSPCTGSIIDQTDAAVLSETTAESTQFFATFRRFAKSKKLPYTQLSRPLHKSPPSGPMMRPRRIPVTAAVRRSACNQDVDCCGLIYGLAKSKIASLAGRDSQRLPARESSIKLQSAKLRSKRIASFL